VDDGLRVNPKGNDWWMKNLKIWKHMGVESLFLNNDPDQPLVYSSTLNFLDLAKSLGFKIGLRYENYANCKQFSYHADYWWGQEFNIELAGPWTPEAFAQQINDALMIKDVPYYISPVYGGVNSPSDDDVRKSWGAFVDRAAKVVPPVISLIEDGVGCSYNLPLRIPGSAAYQDLLNKLAIHKEIVEAHGWKSALNCELFQMTPDNPNTRLRISCQIAVESQYVSVGMGIGPCWQASDLI
jgi:hypothetical protein